MASGEYSFIDIAVHDEVRERFAAGNALVVLDTQLAEVIWANGPGAALFGDDEIEAIIGIEPPLGTVAKRQIMGLTGYPTIGRDRGVTVRIAAGLMSRLINFQASEIELPGGERAILLASAPEKSRNEAEAAARVIGGLSQPGQFVALIGADGRAAAAAPGFEKLGITVETIQGLVAAVGRQHDRLIKKMVPAGKRRLPAGMARVTDTAHLFVVIDEQGIQETEPTVDVEPLQAPAAAEPAAEASAVKAEVEPDALKAEASADATAVQAAVAPALLPTDDVASGNLAEVAAAIAEEPAPAEPAATTPAADVEGPTEPGPATAAVPGTDLIEPAVEALPEPVATEPAPAKDEPAQAGIETPTLSAAAPTSAAETERPAAAAPAEETAPAEMAVERAAVPIRFVWRTDAEGRFSALSPEFADAVGVEAANVIGFSFRDVCKVFGMDADGEIAGLLERRDTWSGRSLLWPVAGTDLKLPVDLAALPVYDRSRNFEGFRGFGVARAGDAVVDPDAIGLSLIEPQPERVPDMPEPPLPETEAAQSEPIVPPTAPAEPKGQDPFLGEVPALSIVPKPDRRFSDKIIRLAEHRTPANDRGLTPLERNAFREIGDRLKKDSNDPARPAEAGKKPAEPAATPPTITAEHAELAPAPAEKEPAELAVKDDAVVTTEAVVAAEAAEEVRTEAEPSAELPLEVELAALLSGDAERQAETAKLDEPAAEAPVEIAKPDLPEAQAVEPPAARTTRPWLLGKMEDAAAQEAAEAEPVLDHQPPAESAPATPAEIAATTDDPADATNAGSPTGEDDGAARAPETDEAVDKPVVSDTIDERAHAASGLVPDQPSEPTPRAPLFESVAAEADAIGSEAEIELAEEQLAAETPAALQAEAVETAEPVHSEEMAADEEAEEADLDEDDVAPRRPAVDTSILDRLPIPVLIHSGDVLYYANREFLEFTAYASVQELTERGGLGELFAEPYPPEGEDGTRKLRLMRADELEVPVEAFLQSVPWNGGKALLLSLRRINRAPLPVPAPQVAPLKSEEKLALEALINELGTIIDTATDGVILISEDGFIRSISRPAEALFGFDSAEVAGKPFASLFAIESQRTARDYLNSLSDNGVKSVLNDGREVIGREGQGRYIPLFMTIGRLPAKNGYCAVLRDITQWKRAEEELTQARSQAERASSQKTEFLARVSHEIRTPLNAIIGFSELMMDEKFGPIGNDRYRDYLRDINRSGNHVLDLVNDLLDISKIEAGQQEMSYEAVSLNDTLSESVALMQPQANRERVIIRSSFASGLPEVVADLRTIRQIALNLLSNAIRYTPAGGQVIVSTAYETTGEVVLRFRDTGIGMSSAEIEQALKPFKQINAIKRPRGDGTGLGLPLTKAMVEANRARFTITSTPGEGTLVEITFPSTRVLAA